MRILTDRNMDLQDIRQEISRMRGKWSGARYVSDLENLGQVYRDPVRRDTYLKMNGNICL